MYLNNGPTMHLSTIDVLTLCHDFDKILLPLCETNKYSIGYFIERSHDMHLWVFHLHLAEYLHVDCIHNV